MGRAATAGGGNSEKAKVKKVTRRVLIRPAAREDIDRHAFFLVENASPRVALQFLDLIDETFRQLLRYPRLGRPYHADSPTLQGMRQVRIRGFRNYLLFYRVGRSHIEVWRLFHGAQDISELLDP